MTAFSGRHAHGRASRRCAGGTASSGRPGSGRVPEQDLRIPLHRIPTRPRSGFRLVVGAP